MKKIQLSKNTNLWLKLNIILMIIFWLFYLFTKAGVFILFDYGLILGTAFCAIKCYLEESSRDRRIKKYEAEFASKNNIENEVINYDVYAENCNDL